MTDNTYHTIAFSPDTNLDSPPFPSSVQQQHEEQPQLEDDTNDLMLRNILQQGPSYTRIAMHNEDEHGTEDSGIIIKDPADKETEQNIEQNVEASLSQKRLNIELQSKSQQPQQLSPQHSVSSIASGGRISKAPSANLRRGTQSIKSASREISSASITSQPLSTSVSRSSIRQGGKEKDDSDVLSENQGSAVITEDRTVRNEVVKMVGISIVLFISCLVFLYKPH